VSVFLELEDLSKRFDGVVAVDHLSLTLQKGEMLALLGPSGSGKTTTLRLLAGFEVPDAGRVIVEQDDVTGVEPVARRFGMVFQHYALFPHLNVGQNVAFGLESLGVRGEELARRVAGALALVDLAGFERRRIGQLSGGQQQRVALARALAPEPRVLLLDEPLSNLDARLRLEARTFLKKLQRDLGITTVFVTHDQAEALALADRIAVMDAGKLRQVGSPREVFARPANTFVANFIGSTPMNLLPGRLDTSTVAVAGGSLPIVTGGSSGAEVTVGIRPEYLTLTAGLVDGPGLRGTVVVTENLGTSSLVAVECSDGTLVGVTVGEAEEPEPGTQVTITAPASRVLLYTPTGNLL
jgi:multiple sugar transport system ATP-binding protein